MSYGPRSLSKRTDAQPGKPGTNKRNTLGMLHRNLNKMMREQRPDTYDRPAEWAQNILCFGYGECRPAPSGGDDKGGLKAMRKPVGASQANTPALSIFPNPATVFATFAYTLPRTPGAAWLAVRDITGRELARIPVAQAEGQAVWDTRTVAPGTYTVELMNDGASLGTAKLVVNP